jgi:hypothetical protein
MFLTLSPRFDLSWTRARQEIGSHRAVGDCWLKLNDPDIDRHPHLPGALPERRMAGTECGVMWYCWCFVWFYLGLHGC